MKVGCKNSNHVMYCLMSSIGNNESDDADNDSEDDCNDFVEGGDNDDN